MATLEHGTFTAKETVLVCKQGCTDSAGHLVTLRSAQLQERVSPGAVYGYDLEVRVGLERYLHHRQRSEIQGALAEQGIALSMGQISVLAARFIRHLEELHQERAPLLREALAADGGYPLHIDATGEDGRGTLFVAYAGWKKWVLASRKLSTERAELILPCLRQVVHDFGIPCAVMRDLGRAVIKATNDLASELDVDLVILSCHLHFLSDIGKDLLEESHNQLRELFRRAGLRAALRALSRDIGRHLGSQLADLRPDVARWSQSDTEHTLPEGPGGRATVRALAQWALDFPQDGEYGSFPFDRPYLDCYHRCLKVRRAADAFLRTPPTDKTVRRALERLARITEPVISQVPFATTAARLSRRAALFDELRTALRLTPRSKPHEPTDRRAAKDVLETSVAELNDIRQALDVLTLSLRRRRPERGPAQEQRQAIDLILEHIERHGESLWGHVINSVSGQDPGIRVVARTNNDLEGFHRRMKHGERRRSGRKILTHDFESLPAGAALVYNLNQPDYVQLLCGSIEELPRAFAELDAERREKERKGVDTAPCDSDPPTDKDLIASSLPRIDRPVIRANSFRRRIEAAAKSRAPHSRCG
ncbi:MAG: hypothetical protein HY323_00270 [Betaproteobacteria bacterium]|nr:hypothetical protein [Betaproteobacteria bacterium]